MQTIFTACKKCSKKSATFELGKSKWYDVLRKDLDAVYSYVWLSVRQLPFKKIKKTAGAELFKNVNCNQPTFLAPFTVCEFYAAKSFESPK